MKGTWNDFDETGKWATRLLNKPLKSCDLPHGIFCNLLHNLCNVYQKLHKKLINWVRFGSNSKMFHFGSFKCITVKPTRRAFIVTIQIHYETEVGRKYTKISCFTALSRSKRARNFIKFCVSLNSYKISN